MSDRTPPTTQTPPADAQARLRAANRRTAALLFAIGAVFFFGFIVTRVFTDSKTGMTVLGIAVLLFLVVAIGRNVRSRQ